MEITQEPQNIPPTPNSQDQEQAATAPVQPASVVQPNITQSAEPPVAQAAPAQDASSSPIQVPSISLADSQNAAVYAQADHNRLLKKQAHKVIIISLIIITVLVGILTLLGMNSEVYSYVQGLSNMASMLLLPAAAVTGGGLAYLIAHPSRIKDPTSPKLTVHIGLVIAGFLFGAIPGLVWVLIIAYPLNHHACVLSGSKYC